MIRWLIVALIVLVAASSFAGNCGTGCDSLLWSDYTAWFDGDISVYSPTTKNTNGTLMAVRDSGTASEILVEKINSIIWMQGVSSKHAAGITFDSVNLYLYAVDTAGPPAAVRAYRMMKTTDNSQVSGPTWNESSTSTTWGIAGALDVTNSCVEDAGDATGPDRVTSAVTNCGYASLVSTSTWSTNWVRVKIGPMYQRWYSGTSSEYGFVLTGQTARLLTASQVRFATSENATATHRPYIKAFYPASTAIKARRRRLSE